jgi:hypothetical protein
MFAWPALGVICLLIQGLSTDRDIRANCHASPKCSYQCIWGTRHCTYCFGTVVLPLSRAVPSNLIIQVLDVAARGGKWKPDLLLIHSSLTPWMLEMALALPNALFYLVRSVGRDCVVINTVFWVWR